jgi:RimJ/RimL family protein N-acetyltransferase
LGCGIMSEAVAAFMHFCFADFTQNRSQTIGRQRVC